MSYFSTIYSDNSLPVRAKTVYMYLRDRSDKERKCWPGINTIAAELNCSVPSRFMRKIVCRLRLSEVSRQ